MIRPAKSAVVLLSGGLDSATVLALVSSQRTLVHAVSVAYGQRHKAELVAAGRLARAYDVLSHRVVHINLDTIGGSALTDVNISVPTSRKSTDDVIPATYVPARNSLFLSIALGLAEVVEAEDIYVGVNALDYSGYPDCRPEFISAFQSLANLATKAGVEGQQFRIHAPLISMSKAQIIRMGIALGVDYSTTVSCYQADSEGRACGNCDACRLRKEGFRQAGLEDLTRYK